MLNACLKLYIYELWPNISKITIFVNIVNINLD